MLKEIIKGKGFKQRYLASKLGVSEVSVSNWVKGKSVPSEDHAKKLAALLEIPIEQLMHLPQ